MDASQKKSVASAGADAQCGNNGGNWERHDKSPERQIFHGQGWRNAIYRTKPAIWTIKSDKRMFKNGSYVGCYQDDGNRQYDSYYDGKKTWKKVKSVDECGALAKKWDKPYFAMQVGQECRLGAKLFPGDPQKGRYPPRMATTHFFYKHWNWKWNNHYACARGRKPTKKSKNYPNIAGNHWTNAVYSTNPSPYYPAAYWDAPAGDATIRMAFARAFCLNIEGGVPKGGKWKAGGKIILWPCVNTKDQVDANMRFNVVDGYIKLRDNPAWCITKKTPRDTNEQLTLQKCGAKKMWQKITTNDDMTIKFAASKKSGFNIWGLGRYFNGWDIRRKPVYSYTGVDGYFNEAFAVQSGGPPTPKPTPVPTPPPGHRGLAKAMGWKIEEGKCTIEIWGGAPCAVSPNYPGIYTTDEKCVVSMEKTKAVKVVDFSSEKYFDRLKFGGTEMSGAPTGLKTETLPKGSNKIEWTSDFYVGSSGWKICKEKPLVVPEPDTKKCDEKLKGHKDNQYRGCQTRTKTGRKCQRWEDQKPHVHGHMSGWKVKSYGLHGAMCRNADNLMRTIWCYTTDPKMKKEECYAGDRGGV